MEIIKMTIDNKFNQQYRLRKVHSKLARYYYDKGECIYSKIDDNNFIKFCKKTDDFLELRNNHIIECISDVVIVSKYDNIIQYFTSKGIKGTILRSAKKSDIKGKIVYGTIPLYLMDSAKEVYTPHFPMKKTTLNVAHIPYDQLENEGMYIRKYFVHGENVCL